MTVVPIAREYSYYPNIIFRVLNLLQYFEAIQLLGRHICTIRKLIIYLNIAVKITVMNLIWCASLVISHFYVTVIIIATVSLIFLASSSLLLG